MRGVRSLLVLAIALASLGLLISNRTPLAVNFLTARSLPLPLGLWLLLALVAGSLTTLMIRVLLSLLGPSPANRRAPSQETTDRRRTGWFGRRSETADWAVTGRRGRSRQRGEDQPGKASEIWDEPNWQGAGRAEASRPPDDRRPPVVDANYRVVSEPGAPSAAGTGRSPATDSQKSSASADDWSDLDEENW
jgi:hypothetical protein